MFTNLKPYPNYAEYDSDPAVALPDHWERRRIKTLIREVDRRTSTGAERLMSLRAIAGLVDHHAEGGKHIPPESLVGYKVVASAQVVMNRMRAASGVFGLADSSGLVSPDYAVFDVLLGSNPSYLLALFKSPLMRAKFRSESKGLGTGESGFLRLYSDRFGAIEVPFPPESDQTAIVKYLGHANARIDRAIAAKRKLIALLKEQKQAVINQAVTRGLDPNVPLKDSGIPWLGQVPVHWPVAALRQRYSQSLGKMLDSGKIVGNDLLPYLRNTDVQWDRINMVDLPEMDISEAEFDRYTVEAGDLLVCEGGDVGRAAIWGNVGRVGYQKALHRLRPCDANEDVPRYLLYGLRAASKAGAFSDGHVSTIAHLTGAKLRAHRFAWPSAAEQQSIVDHLDSSTAATNRTVNRVSHEIELLGEFRTRLTADVVTGQLDIRDAAARLPELDPADLVSDVGTDEDDLDADLAASLEEVDA